MNVDKVWIKAALMRLNWEIMEQAKPTMMARYQQEFCMQEICSWRTDRVLFSMTNIREIQNNWK